MLRGTIVEIVPDAEQGISYDMPAFRMHGTAIAAFKDHLSYLPHSGASSGSSPVTYRATR